ncbi:PHP domain-containing protein [Lagierella sp.]|uniref:PHP domain-containing protein n=1 Tax=Lagierella sp. TaxID=2849657 RepID=UPI002631715C|nr:PHP domain-containing protein [Lagierella sp.]
MFDLHIHSTYSDGFFSVQEIVNMIKSKKLTGFSLTDHDTLRGVKEASYLAKINDLEFIPGVEFGINFMNKEVHILGYFIDEGDSDLNNLTKSLQLSRINRIDAILDKLNELNIPISINDLNKYKKTQFSSRTHIAMYLMEHGYVKSMKESFDKYLGENGLAYIKKDNVSIKEIIAIIKNSGGVAVLAHPFHLDDIQIDNVIKSGIDGIEVINSKHRKNEILKFLQLSQKHKLIPTSGSDCHGRYFQDDLLIGNYLCPKSSVERLKSLHKVRS